MGNNRIILNEKYANEEELINVDKFTDVKNLINSLNSIKKELIRVKEHKNKFKTSTNKSEQRNLKEAIDYSLSQSENKINTIKMEIFKMKQEIEKNLDLNKIQQLKNNYTFRDSKLRFRNTIINVIRCELLELVKKIFKLKIIMKNLIREKLKTELSLIQSKYDEKQIDLIVNNNPEVFLIRKLNKLLENFMMVNLCK